MSGAGGERGWIAVLAMMAVLTAACIVGYLAAPFDPPPTDRVQRSAADVVSPEHRIVAIRDNGTLVLVDARDGEVSDVVVPDGMEGVLTLDVGRSREAAYLGRDDGTVSVLRLRTGEEDALTNGHLPDVGPMSFPQLDADIERPEVEQLASVVSSGETDRISVENLTTGSRTVLGPEGRPPPFHEIDDLAWSPSENVLFGIADGGTVLFRIDADRAGSLHDAVVSDPLPDGDRWIDATAYGDGLAVIHRSAGGDTEIVEVDRRLQRSSVIFRPESPITLTALDADESAAALLITAASGELLHLSSRASEASVLVACCVSRAAW